MTTSIRKLTALLLSAIMILAGFTTALPAQADVQAQASLATRKEGNVQILENAEGMTNNGITIEKAEFCRSKDKKDFGYSMIYGFLYLRLSGAPDDARYRITKSTAGYDHNNLWLVGMPPAHGFSWHFGYEENATIDFDVYDNAGENKLASFQNVSLRVIDCNKPVESELEAGDAGEAELINCDFFSGGPCGSTKADNPSLYEFADGHVYIRVKNIPNAAKFDIEYNKQKTPAADGQPAQYEKTKSKHKGFIGTCPTSSDNTTYFSVPMQVWGNSYMDTPEEQKNKPEFPITVYVYDKDDHLLHTFNDVYPRVVSKYNHMKMPGNGTQGGLEVGQLNILIGKCNTINPSAYTPETAQAFIAARERAEKFVDTRKGTQGQVNFATFELFNAMKNLVPIGGGQPPATEWEFDKDTRTVKKYNGSDVEVSIPAEFEGVSVLHIGEAAFKSKMINKISLPATVKTIGKNAFKDNHLKEVVIPADTVTIGEGAFNDNQIATLTFKAPAKIASIEKDAFRSNALKTALIPASIRSIGETAFAFNEFEEEKLEIDAKKSDVDFHNTALDKNTKDKNTRVNPKFLKGGGTPQPQNNFKMICLLEDAADTALFGMKVKNTSTNIEYAPIKTEVDDDTVTYTFDIPKGNYSYKEDSKFFVICDCGKPKTEDEKVFTFTGSALTPLTLIVNSWKNWCEVTYSLTPQMTLKPYNPADPECSLRAIVKKGEAIKLSQIPQYKLDTDKYEFVGWKNGAKTYTQGELTTYKLDKNIHFLAVIKNKKTNTEIIAEQTQNPPSGGNTGGSGGASGGGASGGGDTADKPKTADTTLDKNADSARFTDVSKTHWANAAINYVAEKGIFKGTSEDKFSPSGKMTRAMFVTALARYFGGEASTEVNFKDVPADSYFAKAVALCVEKKIVNGISAEEFAPAANITREQVATILYRAITVHEKTLKGEKPVRAAVMFNDAERIAPFAQESVTELISMGILTGRDGNLFAPKETLTRAEAAAIFHRLDTLLK